MKDTLVEKTAAATPREIRRAELLDIAIRVISEKGLDNTSFRTLAEAAGSSTTTFTYEFGSREELLAAVLRRAFDIHWSRKGFDIDNDADDPLGKLRQAAWLGVQADHEIDPWVRTYDRFLFEYSFRPELEREIRQLEGLMMGRYLTLIDLAREQGQIDPGMSAEDALFLVWSMIDGLNIHRYVYEQELDRERTARLFNEGFDRVMGVRGTD